MYLLSGLLLLLCVFFFLLNHHRKKKIQKKLCAMDICEKIRLLNELAAPFGFFYQCEGDIMSSTLDAWQRQFGYCALFDKSAPRFNMVFDCEPIRFYCQGKTWLIELWKGQYGINTGAEIGIYQADGQIPPEHYDTALFHSISDSELFPMSMELLLCGQRLFGTSQRHWWLTGFSMGRYTRPNQLCLKAALTFPNRCMLQAFIEAMLQAGYERSELCICNLTVSFCFSAPKTGRPKGCPVLVWWSCLQNRMFCGLFRHITRPYTDTPDRILYLYYYLPAAFRRTLRLKRVPKR